VRHITWYASHGLAKFKRLIAPMNLHVDELSHERLDLNPTRPTSAAKTLI